MKIVLSIIFGFLAAHSSAHEQTIAGRMICEVVASKIVPTNKELKVPIAVHTETYSPGEKFNFDYTLYVEEGLEIFLGVPNRSSVLIAEPFPQNSFKGVSKVTRGGEYRTAYSEVSFNDHLISYKGNDQLFLRSTCASDEWRGFYVETYVSSHFWQVVTLQCITFVDAYDEVLARLAATN